MKRVLLRSLLGVLIGSLLISACSVLGQKPESDSQVSTQVSGVLTALPTSPVAHAATQTAEALEVQQSATPTAEPTLPEDIPTSTLDSDGYPAAHADSLGNRDNHPSADSHGYADRFAG